MRRSMANCLNTKNTQNINKGKIDVLIFLTTINLVSVPVTKIAMMSLINHASTKIAISSSTKNTPASMAELQMKNGLSEQQEKQSAKYRQMNTKEKSMVAQQEILSSSGKQVLMQTMEKRKMGQRTAKMKPKRTGEILRYLILLHSRIRARKARHWVRRTASCGRQIPQLKSLCQFLSTRQITRFQPSDEHSPCSLTVLTQISYVTYVSPLKSIPFTSTLTSFQPFSSMFLQISCAGMYTCSHFSSSFSSLTPTQHWQSYTGTTLN